MSIDDLSPELKSILLAQQQQIAQLSQMISGLSEAVLASTTLSGKVHEQSVGQGVAFQVFAEILMAASPELKENVRAAMELLLARPEATPNESLRAIIEALHRAASDPARASAKERRAGLHIVPPPDDPQAP